MDLGDSPKKLNSLKERKLTRRRVMNAAAAVGFSTPVALNMTVEDVKASDSDQVTISFDIGGNHKTTVPADEMEWIQRASRANKKLTDGHFHKDGVIGVGLRGGKGEENPYVAVTLDKNSNKQEERRGEVPEEQNGIRVEVRERNQRKDQVQCDPDCYHGSDGHPGGQFIIADTSGTNSPQMFDNNLSWFGWTTAAHLFSDSTYGACYSKGEDVDHATSTAYCYEIGTGGDYDVEFDIAFIKEGSVNGNPWNLKPSDHSEGVEIIDTVTEEAMADLNTAYDGESAFFMYGAASCFENVRLDGWNESINNDEYNCNGGDLQAQVTYDHPDYIYAGGDGNSGAIYFVANPEVAGDYYAVSSHSGVTTNGFDAYQWHGVAGYAIANRYNSRRWRS